MSTCIKERCMDPLLSSIVGRRQTAESHGMSSEQERPRFHLSQA